MCIVGGGFGIFVSLIVGIFVLGAWKSKPPYREFPLNVDSYAGGLGKGRSIRAWTCLNTHCRHRNMAGARFCGRCGATRGYTYRADESETAID
ncbi:MAG: hypothetical protein H6819_11520 [Phycisphaerales bacterium]|nr:hypothetical protein [Phycisphaerales bacterium]MCB9856801.1 hypothetical protein [Phycisphaerales bacterium]MCB9862072.1 hypothetical protein [Phycisphaerales bacterium]